MTTENTLRFRAAGPETYDVMRMLFELNSVTTALLQDQMTSKDALESSALIGGKSIPIDCQVR